MPVKLEISLETTQHPEFHVPFQPSSEPCHSVEPFGGFYQISLALLLFSLPCLPGSLPPVSSLVTALACNLDQQQYIPPLFLIWTSDLPSPRHPCTVYVYKPQVIFNLLWSVI
jgi:hypothetical protein